MYSRPSFLPLSISFPLSFLTDFSVVDQTRIFRLFTAVLRSGSAVHMQPVLSSCKARKLTTSSVMASYACMCTCTQAHVHESLVLETCDVVNALERFPERVMFDVPILLYITELLEVSCCNMAVLWEMCSRLRRRVALHWRQHRLQQLTVQLMTPASSLQW